MIVLTQEQKDIVKGLYNGKELNPIEIKGNLYILPEKVLLDTDFPLVDLEQCEIREVQKNEFFEFDIEEIL
jgi:hypothetical protein